MELLRRKDAHWFAKSYFRIFVISFVACIGLGIAYAYDTTHSELDTTGFVATILSFAFISLSFSITYDHRAIDKAISMEEKENLGKEIEYLKSKIDYLVECQSNSKIHIPKDSTDLAQSLEDESISITKG